MDKIPEAYHTTSTGHKLGDGHHLDKHYYALQAEYEETLRAARFQAGWHVLDAGSGNGVFLPLMSELIGSSGRISAIDLAPENVAAVEALAEQGRVVCPLEARVGDITTLSYEDSQFDGLWSANVIQYLTATQLSQAMREFRRVVKPGGVIAIKEVDISVWQFQPQDPMMMWRLLEMLQDDTQFAGAMRGTRLPIWFREAGLADVRSITTVSERRQPLRPIERDYIRSNLEALSNLAASRNLPEGDKREWKRIGEAPDVLLDHPDFCYREMYVLTSARVPTQ